MNTGFDYRAFIHRLREQYRAIYPIAAPACIEAFVHLKSWDEHWPTEQADALLLEPPQARALIEFLKERALL
jgi:hypothetical protein